MPADQRLKKEAKATMDKKDSKDLKAVMDQQASEVKAHEKTSPGNLAKFSSCLLLLP